MPRQLSDGDHIRRLLEFDRLLVAEAGSVVKDDERVERAVFWLAFGCRSAVSDIIAHELGDSRITLPGQRRPLAA